MPQAEKHRVLQVSTRNLVFCLAAGRKIITVCAPDAFAPDSNEATQKLEQQLLMHVEHLSHWAIAAANMRR